MKGGGRPYYTVIASAATRSLDPEAASWHGQTNAEVAASMTARRTTADAHHPIPVSPQYFTEQPQGRVTDGPAALPASTGICAA
jgi:hypothetical protein